MNFKNIAKQLDGDSISATRAWRHEVICRLISAGVVNPNEIKHSVDTLYGLIVSPIKEDQKVIDNISSEKEFIKTNILSKQLNGAHLLNKLINQANLNEDQLDDIKLYLNPNEFLNSKKN